MSHHEQKIGLARNFLVSGGSICPYVKKYAGQTSFGYVKDLFDQEIRNPVLDLAKRPEIMAAVYVFDSGLTSHSEERARSVVLFKGLFKILYIEEHGEQTSAWLQEADEDLDRAFSPGSNINPFMGYKGQPFFSIAMNPAYEPTHPRWAPVSMMAVTRQSDVAAAPIPVRDAIRHEMAERTGSVYDADQLYLMPRAP